MHPRCPAVCLVPLLVLAVPALAQEPSAPPLAPVAAPAPEGEAPRRLFTPTFELNLIAVGTGNPWFGESEAMVGGTVDGWNEGAVEAGVELSKALGARGTLVGRLSGQATWTRGGLDAAGSNLDDRSPEKVLVDDAWLGWRKAPGAGGYEIEASAGRLEYKLGTGLLFWDGGYEGGDRGGWWMNAHDAWKLGAVARVKRGALALRAAYLQPDDETTTRILGFDAEYGLGEAGALGASYHHFVSSDALETIGAPGRDGLGVLSLRGGLTPFAAARGLSLAGEIAIERNASARHALAGYGEVGYRVSRAPWAPRLSYRYSSFGGDDPQTAADESWDPLYFAFNDWGTWYLGEVLGEYAATNSNLVAHQAGLEVAPTESARGLLFYYHFRLQQPTPGESAGAPPSESLGSKDVGDEVNLVLEWAPEPWLQLTAMGGVLYAGDALRELACGDGSWKHAMAYAKLEF